MVLPSRSNIISAPAAWSSKGNNATSCRACSKEAKSATSRGDVRGIKNGASASRAEMTIFKQARGTIISASTRTNCYSYTNVEMQKASQAK